MPSDVPNLDTMEAPELRKLAHGYRHASRAECARIVGDRRPGYTAVVHSTLANYADNKATATECRLRGDASTALYYERIADGLYQSLPADLRW